MRTLFIHSTGTGPFLWDFVPDEVVPEASRLTPANLGYPPLPPLARGQPFSVLDDVAQLRRQLPAGPVHVVAHSYGGLVALKLAALPAVEVRSMFLLEPVMFGAIAHDVDASAEARAELERFQREPWFLEDEALGGTEAWLEMFIDYWNRPGSWKRLPDFMRAHSLAMGWKMFQEVRSVFAQSGTYEENPLPPVPVTLVEGERSPAGSREVIRALKQRHPHARVVTLPGTGHMAPMTHPEKVVEALRAHRATVG